MGEEPGFEEAGLEAHEGVQLEFSNLSIIPMLFCKSTNSLVVVHYNVFITRHSTLYLTNNRGFKEL
jgi:hypothetical protein